MPEHRSRPLRRLSLYALAALLAAAGVELLLQRFPHYLPAKAQFRLHADALRASIPRSLPDDDVGYLWAPNIRAEIRAGDFAFVYATDANGFRNADPAPERADVLILGDSQAFGFGVGDGETWTSQLAAQMPAAEIINLALIGAAPQQALRLFEIYGVPLAPKVVLMGLFPPNALHSARLFADWLAEGKPDRFDLRRMGGDRPDATQDWLAQVKGYLSRSRLVLGAYHFLRQRLTGAASDRSLRFPDGSVMPIMPSRLASAAAKARPGHPDFELVIDVLRRLQERVEQAGSSLIVVLFPTKEEVHLPLSSDASVALLPPFMAALDRFGVRYLDLTPFLQRRAARGERLFFELDIHPNADGYRLIADAIADHLDRQADDFGLKD